MQETRTSETFRNLTPEKQERVVQAAMQEFAEHGFAAASLNRVAKDLSIAKGSLFAYFGSKEQLFHCVADMALEQVKEPLRRIRDQKEKQDFFTQLHAVFLAVALWAREHPRAYGLYLRVLYGGDFPGREQALARLRALSTAYIRPMINDALARGELRPETDSDAAVFVLDSLLDRFVQSLAVDHLDGTMRLRAASAEDLSTRLDALVNILRLGLAHDNKENFANDA